MAASLQITMLVVFLPVSQESNPNKHISLLDLTSWEP